MDEGFSFWTVLITIENGNFPGYGFVIFGNLHLACMHIEECIALYRLLVMVIYGFSKSCSRDMVLSGTSSRGIVVGNGERRWYVIFFVECNIVRMERLLSLGIVFSMSFSSVIMRWLPIFMTRTGLVVFDNSLLYCVEVSLSVAIKISRGRSIWICS